MSHSIRDRQIDALKQMLNFNQSLNANSLSLQEPSWKILIYDRYGQDILSPLFGVKQLRDNGVTLNLLLHSDRDQIGDVPAVYFIQPTQENVQRLCQDIKNDLYESYYLNFISPIPRSLLEEIAQAAIDAECVSQIKRVYDQYLNFISIEDELFFLKFQNKESISYYSLNKGNVAESEMDMIVSTIVDSLFAVCVTLGTVPILRCPKNTAADIIGEKLDKKLRDNLRDSRNNLFANDTSQLNFQRPLMLIIDRNFDLATPLHHTWTYQALLHDTLDLKLNRVEVASKAYDLQAQADKFWKQQKGSPFPNVAESIQLDLEEYKLKEDEIKRLKGSMGFESSSDGSDDMSLLNDNTTKLTSAIGSLPELLERKRLIDMHTNIATCLLDQIKARKLDLYFEMEEKIIGRQSLDTKISDLLNDVQAGSLEDKLRLLIIYYICSTTATQSEIDSFLMQLQSQDNVSNTLCVDCLRYIKRYKSISKMNSSQYASNDTSTINAVSMFSNLLSKSSKLMMEGVKNLVVKQHKLPLTKIVDSLMDPSKSSDLDTEYRYFDPKLIRADMTNNIPKSKSPFNEALVFIIGGGNYIEYQNLLDNAKSKSTGITRKFIYGSTEFINASQLIAQLALLGKEMS